MGLADEGPYGTVEPCDGLCDKRCDDIGDERKDEGAFQRGIRDTPWGTREFALYDMDRNSLTFYRDLKSGKNGHTSG